MFPNPQSALPLPPRPNLERYKKIAKDLVKACRPASEAGDEDPIVAWASEWVDALVRLSGIALEPQLPVRVDEWIEDVAEFAKRQMRSHGDAERMCALADAQFVIARSHGFESWPKFARHLESAIVEGSSQSRFELAADAIVAGDIETLKRLLAEEPGLIRMQSTREHGATLLHYVSANGVEGYRQKTPENIVEIAKILLRAGVEVDAIANVYGGSTTLGLTATSGHPERAGVQEDLLRTLLDVGAQVDDKIVPVCLANGRVRAAEYLAGVLVDQGRHLDLVSAAGLSRLDLVEIFFVEDGSLRPGVAENEAQRGLFYASQFGHDAVVAFLLEHAVDLAIPDGHGQTALHHAVIGGHPETVKLLLRSKPPLEALNFYGGTAFGQALWSAAHGGDPDAYIAILDALAAAGARIPEKHVPINEGLDKWLEEHGSHADPSWYWYGEKPRAVKEKKSMK
jgi:hypothetical protein